MPFSKYNLNVYSNTIDGSYNSNMSLILSAETKPDEKAGTPKDLKVIETIDGSNTNCDFHTYEIIYHSDAW